MARDGAVFAAIARTCTCGSSGQARKRALGQVVNARREADVQGRPVTVAGLARHPLDRNGRGHRLARRAGSPPLRSERDVLRTALEETPAELVLEPLQLLAYRGLGDVQALGGAAEVQLLGQHRERPEQARIESPTG